ncbi:hypothetical protein D3C87_1274010 [compost metagenome]
MVICLPVLVHRPSGTPQSEHNAPKVPSYRPNFLERLYLFHQRLQVSSSDDQKGAMPRAGFPSLEPSKSI